MNTRKYSREFIAGCFVLIGLICIAYMTIKLGRMELFSRQGYFVSAVFSSVSGLRVGADVEIAGVSVGRVTEIGLEQGMAAARVTLNMRDGVVLGEDTVAAIKTSGIIGDKFIELSPGNTQKPMQPGGVITASMGAADIDDLINQFSMSSAYSSQAYTLHAMFSSVAGLQVGAAVQIAGVSVGQVSAITLDHAMGVASISMRINREVELPSDVIASIKTNGLIGGKYVSLSLGASEEVLKDGGSIHDTEPSLDIEALISKFALGGV